MWHTPQPLQHTCKCPLALEGVIGIRIKTYTYMKEGDNVVTLSWIHF